MGRQDTVSGTTAEFEAWREKYGRSARRLAFWWYGAAPFLSWMIAGLITMGCEALADGTSLSLVGLGTDDAWAAVLDAADKIGRTALALALLYLPMLPTALFSSRIALARLVLISPEGRKVKGFKAAFALSLVVLLGGIVLSAYCLLVPTALELPWGEVNIEGCLSNFLGGIHGGALVALVFGAFTSWILGFSLERSMAQLIGKTAEDPGKRQNAANLLRFTVAWPTIYTYGIGFVWGIAVQAFRVLSASVEPDAEQAASLLERPSTIIVLGLSVLAFLLAAAVYYRLTVGEKKVARILGSKEGSSESSVAASGDDMQLSRFPGGHLSIATLVVFFCFYLGRFEILLAMIACGLMAVAESHNTLALHRWVGGRNPECDPVKKCEFFGNIVHAVLFFFSMVFMSFAFAASRDGNAEGASSALEGVKSYEIIVVTASVLVVGYFANITSPSTNEGRGGVARRFVAPLTLLVPTLFTALPLFFPGSTGRLAAYGEDAAGLTVVLGAVGLAAGVFSISYSLQGSQEKGIWALLNGIRHSFEGKLSEYTSRSKAYHWPPLKRGGQDDKPEVSGYRRTMREMLLFCAFFGLACGQIFSAAAPYFNGFALTYLLAVFFTYLFDFFYRRGFVD